MGDVAQILGGASKRKNTSKPAPPPPLPAGSHPSRSMKMTGLPKEVMDLVGGNQDAQSAALPPAVPTFSGQAAAASASGGGASGANSTDATGAAAAVGSANTNGSSSTAGQATIKIGNKWINTKKPARKWVWAPFASSARSDGLLLNHWIRAEVEYPDYPYARFNCHLDPVTYTEGEYRDKLQHESWTKSETDQLMELARKFELRWPVIYDRWFELYHSKILPSKDNKDGGNQQQAAHAVVSRKIEDLQHRYYSVAAIITQHRIAQEAAAEAQALAASVPDANQEDPKAAADALLIDTTASRTVASTELQHQPLIHNLGSGTTNKIFDLNYEKERRAHLESLWHRSKEEEEEEDNLRKELRLVEAQLRKLKKTGGHILAAANSTAANTGAGAAGPAGGAASGSAASSRDVSRSASPAITAEAIASKTPGALLDQSFASTAPTPMPGTPYLQSGRLIAPATGGAMGLNKTLLSRMDSVLGELKIPPRPIPTKRVCDLYDTVRKDILTLLTLQKMVLQKEGQLQSKRLKLSKMGGSIKVADEETALGVPKPQPAPAPAPAPSTPAQQAAAAAAAAAGPSSKAKPAAAKAKATPGGGKTKAAADPTKAATATKAKSDSKGKSGEGAAGKQASTGGKGTAGGKQAAAAAAKQTAAATGGKQAPQGKQAAVAGGKAAATGGKQVPGAAGGKGGKSAKKPPAKRKRKSETKASAAATAGAPTPAASAPAPAPANSTAPAANAAAGPVAAPTAAAPAPQSAEAEGKGKKRARKS